MSLLSRGPRPPSPPLWLRPWQSETTNICQGKIVRPKLLLLINALLNIPCIAGCGSANNGKMSVINYLIRILIQLTSKIYW